MKISLLAIKCSNIEISKRFYECLGLTFKKEKHGKGPEHYSSELDDFVFELYPVSKTSNTETEPTDNTRLGFNISNIKQVVSNLNIISQYEFNGNTIYIVADPDGRKIELH